MSNDLKALLCTITIALIAGLSICYSAHAYNSREANVAIEAIKAGLVQRPVPGTNCVLYWTRPDQPLVEAK
jgi:hypothetical protein